MQATDGSAGGDAQEGAQPAADSSAAAAVGALVELAAVAPVPVLPAEQPVAPAVTIHIAPPADAGAVDPAEIELECESSVLQHEGDVYLSMRARDGDHAPALDPPSTTVSLPSPSASPCGSSLSPPAAGSSSSPLLPAPPAAATSAVGQPEWLHSLRAEWEGHAAARAAPPAPASPAACATSSLALRAAVSSRVRLLSPAVQAQRPLEGDVEWKPVAECRRVTVEEYVDFLIDSKLHAYRFHRLTRQVRSMFLPTLLLAVVIGTYALAIVAHRRNPLVAWSILVYRESPADSAARKLAGSLLNALEVLAAIITVTAVFITLFYLQWWLALRRFLTCLILSLLLPVPYFGLQFLRYYSLPADWVSWALVQVNFLAVGYVALVQWAETASNWNRAYLLFLAWAVAWPFIEFSEWTVWTTIVLLTIYDLLAVLCPCGPLRWIMQRQAATRHLGHTARLPGMMYVGEFFSIGLGDLIFYGALMGRAAKEGVLPLVTCTIGVLMGVAGTIVWSYHTTAAAIPALPLSVLFGLSFYVTTALCIRPMLEQAARHGWQV